MTFEDDLSAQDEANNFVDLPIQLNGTLYTFRFYEWSGIQWANEADNHPARPGVEFDVMYGYNIRTLALAAAKVTGRRLDADGETLLAPQMWDAIFRSAGGGVVQEICDSIWGLNVLKPLQAVEAAKKASAASSALTSD